MVARDRLAPVRPPVPGWQQTERDGDLGPTRGVGLLTVPVPASCEPALGPERAYGPSPHAPRPGDPLVHWLRSDPFRVHVHIGEPALPFATLVRAKTVMGTAGLTPARNGQIVSNPFTQTHGATSVPGTLYAPTDVRGVDHDEEIIVALSLPCLRDPAEGARRAEPAPRTPAPSQPTPPLCAPEVTLPVERSAMVWVAIEAALLIGAGLWRRMRRPRPAEAHQPTD